jgi:hypothetical protein
MLRPAGAQNIGSLANSFFPLAQGKKGKKRDQSGRSEKPRV